MRLGESAPAVKKGKFETKIFFQKMLNEVLKVVKNDVEADRKKKEIKKNK